MKKTAGRLPSSAGGLYSFGPFFSRNFGYRSMTTSAFGSRPNQSWIRSLARASAACERAIRSSGALEQVPLLGPRALQQRRHIAGAEDRSPMAFISASRRSTSRRPVACTSLAGVGSELW